MSFNDQILLGSSVQKDRNIVNVCWEFQLAFIIATVRVAALSFLVHTRLSESSALHQLLRGAFVGLVLGVKLEVVRKIEGGAIGFTSFRTAEISSMSWVFPRHLHLGAVQTLRSELPLAVGLASPGLAALRQLGLPLFIFMHISSRLIGWAVLLNTPVDDGS